MPSISGLATTFALTAVENKIPSVSNLVKETDYNTKVNKIEKKITDQILDKYISSPEFNKLTAKYFAARFRKAILVTMRDFDDKLSDPNRKIVLNKTKHLVTENELKKLKTLDSSYFHSKINFEDDGKQKWLLFQPYVNISELLHLPTFYYHGNIRECQMNILNFSNDTLFSLKNLLTSVTKLE